MKINCKNSKNSGHDYSDIWQKYVESGNPSHMIEIYEKFNEIIYFVAYKILNDRSKALDVTQDVFEQLMTKREKYARIKHFSSWIYTLTKNRALKVKKNSARFLSIEDRESEASYELEIGESLQSRNLKLLNKLISSLKGKNFARVINLELEGKSNKEIASILGKNEKYVRDRKHLAKKELTELYSSFTGNVVLAG